MNISLHRIGRVPSGRFLPSLKKVSRAVRATLVSEKIKSAGDVSVVFVDSKTIRRLNRRFLDEKGSTDVIAFPYDHRLSPQRDVPLGDIYISVPDAHANARRFGETPERELIRLVVHGTLHLLGHDDHAPKKRAVMWKKQEALVEKLCR